LDYEHGMLALIGLKDSFHNNASTHKVMYLDICPQCVGRTNCWSTSSWRARLDLSAAMSLLAHNSPPIAASRCLTPNLQFLALVSALQGSQRPHLDTWYKASISHGLRSLAMTLSLFFDVGPRSQITAKVAANTAHHCLGQLQTPTPPAESTPATLVKDATSQLAPPAALG
jgi:hypothetical protein